jgi:hypothetical protein
VTAPRFDRDEVRAELRATTVLERFGVKGRRSGAEFRTRLCPTCGPRTRADAVSINLRTGRWKDHAHGCAGDVLALLAGLAGIDQRTRFPELLALAAELAGIDTGHARDERVARQRGARRREAQQREHERDVADAAARRADAIQRATSYWSTLSVISPVGEAYLRRREVFEALDLVRFDRGSIAVPLHTADGQIVNVVRRRIDGGEPKVFGLKGCPTAGTFVDAIADITHGRDVVLVEGVFDALTARLAWPEHVVLGAHGAGRIPTIAAAAVKRCRVARVSLLLVPHADEAGTQNMIAAGRLALAAGLTYGRSLHVIDPEALDLNDAWCRGWRPPW